MIEQLPDVIVVGDIEMLFLGMALALGAPKMARRALDARYSEDEEENEDDGSDPEEVAVDELRDDER